MPSCLEVNTILYSVSEEKTSVAYLREEWLIVLFRRWGNLYCKERPWQLPYSGEMARAPMLLFSLSETSETRLREPVEAELIWVILLLEGFFGKDASVHYLQEKMMRVVLVSFWNNTCQDFLTCRAYKKAQRSEEAELSEFTDNSKCVLF